MNIFAHIEPFQEFDDVMYYTLRFEYDDEEFDSFSEMEKFIEKFKTTGGDIYEEFSTILTLIKEIGYRGAKAKYFRSEELAEALPGRPSRTDFMTINIDSKVRLYCIRLSESVVILYNGDIKTVNGAEFCPNVKGYFREINKIAKNITREIRDNHFILEHKCIRCDDELSVEI